MSENFNKLTPAEDERLTLLIEECSEVIKAACKIQRHGYESYNPDSKARRNNRMDLTDEMGDLWASMIILMDAHDVEEFDLRLAQVARLKHVGKYLHHQSSAVNGTPNVCPNCGGILVSQKHYCPAAGAKKP